MKRIEQLGIILLYLSLSSICRCQEFNIGGETGTISNLGFSSPAFNLNSLFEFRPKHSFFSVNTAPGVIIFNNNLIIGSFPLSLKFILGDKYRFCPKIGVFYWTNQRWGMTGGFNFEVVIRDKLSPFLSADLMRISFREQIPSHFGGSSTQLTSSVGLKLSIGLKYLINQD